MAEIIVSATLTEWGHPLPAQITQRSCVGRLARRHSLADPMKEVHPDRGTQRSLARAARVLGLQRLFDDTARISGSRSRFGSDLCASNSKFSRTALDSAASELSHASAGPAHFLLPDPRRSLRHLPPVQSNTSAPPLTFYGHGNGTHGRMRRERMDALCTGPVEQPSLRTRRSSHVLHALAERAHNLFAPGSRATPSLRTSLAQGLNDSSLDEPGDVRSSGPILPPLRRLRSQQLLCRLGSWNLFHSSSENVNKSCDPQPALQGFSRAALRQGSITQLRQLLRQHELLAAFVLTARDARISSAAARTSTLREAMRVDAKLKTASDLGLLALYDTLYLPRISARMAQDPEMQRRLDIRTEHQRGSWAAKPSLRAEQYAKQLLPRLELFACKVGLERLLTSIIYLVEPPAGPEVVPRIDWGTCAPLSLAEWKMLLAPWQELTPEAIAQTHSMLRRQDR